MDHMERVAVESETVPPGYYIPHHAVCEKFRVVFNGSMPTTTRVSINDTQIPGPRIQDTLVNIIHRFRRFKVAFTADVEKMFRQILIDKRHRQFQQILWRERPEDDLQIFELKTVTYGLASSPFLSVRVCGMDNCEVVPDSSRASAARECVLSSFYVDDLLESVDTPEEAVILANDVKNILLEGCFNLRKWNSNHSAVLSELNGTLGAAEELQLDDRELSSVLGLLWNPVTDSFQVERKLSASDS